MLRTCAALAAAVLVPGTAGAKELKPKFGNIDGVYYSDVSGNRDACRQAIRNKIALCRQNTNFESNTKNRKYKGCLPIFRRQAQSCVVHFRHQMSKCDLSGAARITDFTGFSCTATATVVEDGGGPDIAPLDRRMTARTRVNLRAGPGTNHRVVGSLAAGQAVQATGRAGDWLRIVLQGRTAFVHGQFMAAMAGQGPAQQGRGPAAGPSPKCAGMKEGAKCWNELANKPGCHIWKKYSPKKKLSWSGACVEGKASGRGRLVDRSSKEYAAVYEVTLQAGRMQGQGTVTWPGAKYGGRYEGEIRDFEAHGRGLMTFNNGTRFEGEFRDDWLWRGRATEIRKNGRYEGEYRNGTWHGRGTYTWSNGARYEGEWRNGRRHGRGTMAWPKGSRYEGEWRNGKEHGRGIKTYPDGYCVIQHHDNGKFVSGKKC